MNAIHWLTSITNYGQLTITCCATDYKYLLGDGGSFTVPQVPNILPAEVHLVYHYVFFRYSLKALLFDFRCGTR